MRQNTITKLALIAALVLAAGGARAQLFSQWDWVVHRGTPTHLGHNSGEQVAPTSPKVGIWKYPSTPSLLAEAAVDNTGDPAVTPLAPMFPPANLWSNAPGPPIAQQFSATPAASWFYPVQSDRGLGAWPPSDSNADKLGDFFFANAIFDDTLFRLHNLGVNPNSGLNGDQELARLPNASGYLEQPLPQAPYNGRNLYKTVD